jgi:hypothetical protein
MPIHDWTRLEPGDVGSVGLGDPLPTSPIFLSETRCIPAPLEATYMRAWAAFPALLKEIIEPPIV